ncbi:MAG: DJ-1/PfpI family protein [Deltaproteobacteria bacterium]|jgi:4-methyl-5(b-hydroxyethyl)-thiazole monophosphate biosynthesis|nr:DJ-1/PfpI family protein [Deltaproteobacteria bacterium]
MAQAAVFIINGFEEIEAVATIDILRRAGVKTEVVSLEPTLQVTGSHQLVLTADRPLAGLNPDAYDILIIPGGTIAYVERPEFMSLIAAQAAKKSQRLAAICAAPTVFGRLGLLKGLKAVCYPGFEKELTEAQILNVPVVTDGLITTGRGPGLALDFALEIVSLIVSLEAAQTVKKGLLLA